MTAEDAFRQYTTLLQNHAISDAAGEARVMLCHILRIDQAAFFAHPGRLLTGEEQSALSGLVERRLKGEPSAYLVKHKEFYGIDLFVDSRVLIPRPETEILVEAVLEYGRSREGKLLVADVGTGSGAIAVALALNLPDAFVYAVDISPGALEVAGRNVMSYGLQDRISLLPGDLLSPLPGPVDVIAANLPYIAGQELPGLPVEVSQYEPGIALDGGEEGTVVIGRLLDQVKGRIRPGGIVFLEIGQGQEDEIFKMVKSAIPGGGLSLLNDLSGIKRVAKISVPAFDIDECLL